MGDGGIKAIVREAEVMERECFKILEKFVDMAINRMDFHLSLAVDEMEIQEYRSARIHIKQFMALSEITSSMLLEVLEDIEKEEEGKKRE